VVFHSADADQLLSDFYRSNKRPLRSPLAHTRLKILGVCEAFNGHIPMTVDANPLAKPVNLHLHVHDKRKAKNNYVRFLRILTNFHRGAHENGANSAWGSMELSIAVA
jgi:hypothetical protein